MAPTLATLVRHLDEYLRIRDIPDDTNAVNGLQLEASGPDAAVEKIALAVDAAEFSVQRATELGAQLLLVHHGLLWSGLQPMRGPHARKLGRCFRHGLSVYAAHLPLDVHPEVGNNAELMRALGLVADGTFGKHAGIDIGLTAPCDLSLDELQQRVATSIGPARRAGHGPERLRRIGVCSGGAGSLVASASRAGLDLLLTGEGPHYAALEAEERGIHLLLAGHYRTETFGVRALGEKLAAQFGVAIEFIEHDTGM